MRNTIAGKSEESSIACYFSVHTLGDPIRLTLFPNRQLPYKIAVYYDDVNERHLRFRLN